MPTRRFCLKFVPAATFAWLFGTRETKVVASESLKIKLDADAAKMAADLKQKLDQEIERRLGEARPKARRLPEVEWVRYNTKYEKQYAKIGSVIMTVMQDPDGIVWTIRTEFADRSYWKLAANLSEAKQLAIESTVELIESSYHALQEIRK